MASPSSLSEYRQAAINPVKAIVSESILGDTRLSLKHLENRVSILESLVTEIISKLDNMNKNSNNPPEYVPSRGSAPIRPMF